MSEQTWTAIAVVSAGSARTGLLRRFVRSIQAARVRQAQREIRRHLQFVPEDILGQAGCTPSVNDDGALPFTRQE